MKKGILIAFIFFLLLGGVGKPARAQTVGPNISSDFTYVGIQNQIRQNYAGNATATVLIDIGCALNLACVQERKGQIDSAGIVVPVIRVSNNAGSAVAAEQARTAGINMAQVFPNQWVMFGNEVNNITKEWSGGTPASYADSLQAFIEGSASKIRVLPAALDPVFEESSGFTAQAFIQLAYSGRSLNISGLAFNAYHSGEWGVPGALTNCNKNDRQNRCSWLSVRDAYASVGMTSGNLILTEYSLYPFTEDTDLARVIKFIDDTKAEMASLGITKITPLIRNPCGAIDGSNNWPWLLFVNGSPSKILEPNLGTDVSQGCRTSAVNITGGLGQCEPLPQASGTVSGTGSVWLTIGNAFADLASFVTSLFTGTDEAAWSDGIANLSHIQPINRGEARAYPIKNKPAFSSVTYTATLKKTANIFLAPLVELFFPLTGTRQSEITGAVWNLSCDQTSGECANQGVKEQKTLQAHWCGADCNGPAQEEITKWAKGDKTSDLPLKLAGALAKLSPFQCRNINGEFKKCSDAKRDDTICSVITGYCKHPAFNGRGCQAASYTPVSDIIVGRIWQLPGTTSTVAALNPPPDVVSRPMLAVEFACTNQTFACAGMTRDDINHVCGRVMGPDFAQGLINANSDLVKNRSGDFPLNVLAALPTLSTPSEQELYSRTIGQGTWFNVPTQITQETGGTVTECTQLGEYDPEPDTNIFNESNCRKSDKLVSYPLQKAAADELAGIFTAPDIEKKKQEINPQVAPVQCGNTYGVTGQVPAVIGKASFGALAQSLIQRVIGPSVGGISDTRGQVLQAADPPIPTPTPNTTVEAKRTYSLTMEVPQEANDFYKDTSGPQGGLANFMPFEIATAMQTPVDGVNAPAQFPMTATAAFGSDIQGSNITPIPLIGGSILANEIVTDLILPYDPNKQANSGKLLRQLAKSNPTQVAQINPWQDLASFQNPTYNKLSQK